MISVSSQPRGSAAYRSRAPIGPPPSSTGTLRPERIRTSTKVRAISPQRRSVVASCMTAGRLVVNASAHGPAANTSWVSSRVWARWPEALAQRSLPSMSASMIPAASASNRLLAATTASCRVAARSCSGCRSVRVPMLLASIDGSIGMGVPLLPVAELANPVNRPGTTMAWGANQAQQAHEVVGALRWFHRDDQETDPPLLPGRAAGNPWVRALVAGLGWRWLLRPLTSLVSWYQAAE